MFSEGVWDENLKVIVGNHVLFINAELCCEERI